MLLLLLHDIRTILNCFFFLLFEILSKDNDLGISSDELCVLLCALQGVTDTLYIFLLRDEVTIAHELDESMGDLDTWKRALLETLEVLLKFPNDIKNYDWIEDFIKFLTEANDKSWIEIHIFKLFFFY